MITCAHSNAFPESLAISLASWRIAIHLPNPSYFPFFFALGLPLMFYGVIYHKQLWGKGLIIVGLIIALAAVIGWAIEPLEEPHGDHDEEQDAIPPSPPAAVLPPSEGETESSDD